jgi:hypothetical protein
MAPVKATPKSVRGCDTAHATAKNDNGLGATARRASH